MMSSNTKGWSIVNVTVRGKEFRVWIVQRDYYALSTLRGGGGGSRGCERRQVANRQIELATSSIGSVIIGYKKSSLGPQATQHA